MKVLLIVRKAHMHELTFNEGEEVHTLGSSFSPPASSSMEREDTIIKSEVTWIHTHEHKLQTCFGKSAVLDCPRYFNI